MSSFGQFLWSLLTGQNIEVISESPEDLIWQQEDVFVQETAFAGLDRSPVINDSSWLYTEPATWGGLGGLDGNITGNSSVYDNTLPEIVPMVITAVVLGIIILATVVGNVFVIAAILIERNLQNVANYLILSLAVADLLVACLVMPLGAVYEVRKRWTLGPELCDMWTSSDVLCCTASILHLVAIALDRYWAVTNIDYIHQRTKRRIMLMILAVWSVSFLVCVAPMLGWKDPGWQKRISEDLKCLISQDVGYQIFATVSSFYLPLLVILILYWRIFQTARKRIRRRQGAGSSLVTGPTMAPLNPAASGAVAASSAASGGIAAAVVTVIGRPLPTLSETTTAFTNVSSTNSSPEKGSLGNGIEADPVTGAEYSQQYGQQYQKYQQRVTKRKTRDAADSKRERKAAKTLVIITGAFVFCWLPFFVLAIIMSTCSSCNLSPYLMSLMIWLGYFNSTLNPIIYTIFSPEFRHAFKRLLCGRRYGMRKRKRHMGIIRQ